MLLYAASPPPRKNKKKTTPPPIFSFNKEFSKILEEYIFKFLNFFVLPTLKVFRDNKDLIFSINYLVINFLWNLDEPIIYDLNFIKMLVL